LGGFYIDILEKGQIAKNTVSWERNEQ